MSYSTDSKIIFSSHTNIVAVIGFEQLNYTVNETGIRQEVCVQVFNPPQNEELGFDIFWTSETKTGTAGK